jgi:transcriptional regulator NrdR family protein
VCKHEESRVFDSRPTGPNDIRRRRECLKCGARWTTYEVSAQLYEQFLPILKCSDRILLVADIINELSEALGAVNDPKLIRKRVRGLKEKK